MTSIIDVTNAINLLLPKLSQPVFTGGVATAQSPPWVVVSLSETKRETSEGGSISSHVGTLNIRVVSTSSTSVNVICEKLSTALDFARPAARGVSQLVPNVDSGVYASDLTQDKTGTPFMMRVLTWLVGWSV